MRAWKWAIAEACSTTQRHHQLFSPLWLPDLRACSCTLSVLSCPELLCAFNCHACKCACLRAHRALRHIGSACPRTYISTAYATPHWLQSLLAWASCPLRTKACTKLADVGCCCSTPSLIGQREDCKGSGWTFSRPAQAQGSMGLCYPALLRIHGRLHSATLAMLELIPIDPEGLRLCTHIARALICRVLCVGSLPGKPLGQS